jgi:signal transduction histidine kinase
METEIILIISILTAVIIIFIAGLLLFISRLKSRRVLYEKEKANIQEQHKHDLLNNRLKVQQQTMQFIGSEIHDSVAQKLTLATLYSRKLELENINSDIADKQQNISNIINDSLEELKDLARTLSNYSIQDKELSELVNLECRKITMAGVCQVESIIDYNRPLPFMIKSSVLRIIQEFMQNSLKHSGCSLITLNLSEKQDGLSILLADNGKGFDSVGLDANGVGLSNMKRRTKLIGGTFDLNSLTGSGTTLKIFIDHKNLYI